ncbi:Anaphase promoting complex subunit, putative [Candida maltosa Xu316]|uniref:Anaphase promoting complex subunit, putative n=1 Tax=Candida maltosa (strain Xu316) TaxID=1245528 RepID=M3IH52_CANMX|nr:Anaphase promoting complex subunit, putative [Candida maltosa Xu316]
MNSSGFWDQSGITNSNNSFPSQHEVQLQRELSQDEIRESILLSTSADQNLHHNHLIHAIDDENCSIGTDHNQLYGIDEDENDDFLENSSRMRRSGLSIDDEVYEEEEGGENQYRRDDEEEEEEEEENDEDQIIEDQSHRSSNHTNTDSHPQPSLEQIQRVYYLKGLQELESLQLFDLSPLANWKLSSWKQGFGLKQLRDDSPDTYWQSDGSNSGNSHNNGDNNANQQQQQQQQNPNNSMLLNHLSTPHSITIQFSKKVALERISIFTNYSLDESYTPSKIKIMAGSSEGWDLIEVCTVNFDQPIGWSHIIFNGIRNDGVLKCFLIKIIILANHQEGKDSHIRAIRCFGKKSSFWEYSIEEIY